MKKLALDESNHPVLAFLCFLLSCCIIYIFHGARESFFFKYKGAGMNDERFYVGGIET